MAVVIETTLGDITVDLYLNQRPVTCLNFLKLCKMKYYNYNLFHSIRSDFIAQTGDPSGEGSGGESIWGILEGPEKRFFSGEKMPRIKHTDAGLLSMVCTGDMMIGSQFFFTLAPDLDSLDGQHCVIGEVTEGNDVLRKLNEVICDEGHRPYRDVRITHTVVLEDPFNDPVGLRAPSRSPSPSAERLKGGRIAPDEEIDETLGKNAAEVQELIEQKEAKARATILEIIGDLPDADIAPPENVLFVCKLNPVTTDEDLEIIFSRFGKIVNCEVIRDKKTGDSLQYAFIEFDNKKSCEDAYFKMDNVLIDDRRIHVDFSQSVSKVKWLGKGRGVRHFNDEETPKARNHERQQSRERDHKNERQHERDRCSDSKRNHSTTITDERYSKRQNNDDKKYKDKSPRDSRQHRLNNLDKSEISSKDRAHNSSKEYIKNEKKDKGIYNREDKRDLRESPNLQRNKKHEEDRESNRASRKSPSRQRRNRSITPDTRYRRRKDDLDRESEKYKRSPEMQNKNGSSDKHHRNRNSNIDSRLYRMSPDSHNSHKELAYKTFSDFKKNRESPEERKTNTREPPYRQHRNDKDDSYYRDQRREYEDKNRNYKSKENNRHESLERCNPKQKTTPKKELREDNVKSRKRSHQSSERSSEKKQENNESLRKKQKITDNIDSKKDGSKLTTKTDKKASKKKQLKDKKELTRKKNKPKRKPSTSSDTDSDSSSSSSTSSSSSSESDRMRKKKKRKYSTSSSSETSSSSSDSSTSSSDSSSSDSERTTKQSNKSRKKKNVSKNKKKK